MSSVPTRKPQVTPASTARFWAKVETTGVCWLWTGYTNRGGYGVIYAGAMVPAHRFAYELLVGPIPDGLVIDHLCRTKACVNPDHLEPVTQGENVRRGLGAGSQYQPKSDCVNGHPFTDDNTVIAHNGQQRCLKCRAAEQARRQQRFKATREVMRAARASVAESDHEDCGCPTCVLAQAIIRWDNIWNGHPDK